MRLQRFLAQAGLASRRASEEIILSGRVAVNGKIVRVLGTRVEPSDRVELDGCPVVAQRKEILALHKPIGIVTTMRDPEGRKTVGDLLRELRGPAASRLVPVGRLDYATAGLLLVTNDGDLAHALTHPRFGVDKVYRVTLRGRLDSDAVQSLREGIFLDGRRTTAARMRVVATTAERSVIDLTIHEGRYRQVRRMFEAMGHRVLALVRLRFGPVALGSLAPGRLRELSPSERKALDALVRNSR